MVILVIVVLNFIVIFLWLINDLKLGNIYGLIVLGYCLLWYKIVILVLVFFNFKVVLIVEFLFLIIIIFWLKYGCVFLK